jgi:hypothetical protein
MEYGIVVFEKVPHKTEETLFVKRPSGNLVEIALPNGPQLSAVRDYWLAHLGKRVSFQRNSWNAAADIKLL